MRCVPIFMIFRQLYGSSFADPNRANTQRHWLSLSSIDRAKWRYLTRRHACSSGRFLRCQCQCQSKIFSVAKIAELLRSPQTRSRVIIQNQEITVGNEMFLDVDGKQVEMEMIECQLAAVSYTHLTLPTILRV